ncbi:MAG: phosphoglycerate dehydrogenase [Acidimicrobiales bacterium]|nr:phosphoglycerate dehydrogenase [Acidimicrobiales bacterium]|tara:strand:- start:9504 stop:11072 length:1569 start_codon:yes stop_codon:yes gene_type:complete
MARVVVSEKLAEAGLDLLRARGHEVDVRLDLSATELQSIITDAEALIVRSATLVDDQLLEAAKRLQVVGRAGVGLDNVDTAAATSRGILVCNAPESNVVSAAEHSVALLLALARNIPQAHAALTGGRWERGSWTGTELLHKTVGIVGLGRVGRLVAQRVAGFDVRLLAYDPFVSSEAARSINVEMVELDVLLGQSDFVTVHLPKNAQTTGLFDAKQFSKFKPGARLVNAARGGVIVEADLVAALDNGQLAGAALDVFDTEPKSESPLFGRPEVVVTPHLGASTHEAQDRASITIAEQVALALDGDFVPFAVNIAAQEASDALRPYLGVGERLGTFLAGLVSAVPDDIEVRTAGEISGYDRRILVLSVLRGLLRDSVNGPVTFVNAFEHAERMGVLVRDVGSLDAGEFRNLVEVRGGGHSVAGTLVRSGNEPRIVMIDDHSVEVPFANYMLVIRNDDRPGMIGIVGTILGRAEVNISFMGLGRDRRGDHALMALAADAGIADDVLETLNAEPGIRSVSLVRLD